MKKLEDENRRKARDEERRSKNKGKGELKLRDVLSGNIPDTVIQEINRPDKQIERNRFTKDYMMDFFKRNLTRPSQEKSLPDYLQPFTLDAEEAISPETLYRQLKNGKYDIVKEERMLIKLRRSLGQRGDVADKILAKLGLCGLQK